MATIQPTDDDFLDPKQWISTQELADILGVKVQTIWNRVTLGEDFPEAYKISKRLTRFFKPDVKAWLLSRQHVTAGTLARRRREAATEARA